MAGDLEPRRLAAGLPFGVCLSGHDGFVDRSVGVVCATLDSPVLACHSRVSTLHGRYISHIQFDWRSLELAIGTVGLRCDTGSLLEGTPADGGQQLVCVHA